jgi:hypothetical protein
LILFIILSFKSTALSAKSDDELSWKDFQNPPVEYRPWTRWWWPGNDVDGEELRREVKLLKDNYYGGAEIQPFIMGLDPDADKEEMARRMSFDSPSFYSHLSTVMETAKDEGIGIDLNLGSGWPSGGQHVGPDLNLKTLLFSEQKVRGGRKINVKLKDPKKPIFYYLANIVGSLLNIKVSKWHGDDAEIFAVVAAKITGGKRSMNPVKYSDTIELDPDSVAVLTDKVDDKRRLRWQAPAGKWMIVTVYIAPNGEFPTLAAQDPPGYVVDHFDREAAEYHFEHLLGERTGLAKYYGAPFRAFFNDSFEFKAERHVSEDFLEQFKKRRGYDLTPYLPVVLIPGADNFFYEMITSNRRPEYRMSDMDGRIRYDYQLTMSDLFIERYLDTAREWADRRGIMSRAQCYGMDIDVIRAAGHAHVPETEQLYAGGSEMFLKIASSGAHLYNRPIVTSESMVWSGRDYMTTPLKVKAAADKLFTSGVNQIIFHGYTYKKDDPEYGETGWYPWSSPFSAPGVFSSNLSEANPYFKYMKDLNQYIARCQYLLRQGKPDYDLVVYYPWLGLPSSFGNAEGHEEFLFNGHFPGEPESVGGIEDAVSFLGIGEDENHVDPRIAWLQKVWPLLQELENHGYTWEWVNDHSLAEAELKDHKINIRGNDYKAIVIAHAPWMQPAAATRLSELSKSSAAFLIVGEPPSKQPGFNNNEEGDHVVHQAMERIIKSDRAKKVTGPKVVAKMLAEIKVEQGLRYSRGPQPVRHIKRRFGRNGQIIFLYNPTPDTHITEVDVEGGCPNAEWMDSWAGEIYEALNYDCGDLLASFEPYNSLLLVCGNLEEIEINSVRMERDFKTWMPGLLPGIGDELVGGVIAQLDSWELVVIGEEVAGGSFKRSLTKLVDWREIKELRFCSSPGSYRTSVKIDDLKTDTRMILDLGWLYGAAEVSVNGQNADTLLIPSFRLDVTNYLQPGKNIIEVKVIPALRNRFIGFSNSNEKRYKQFKGKDDSMLPTGLIGPVQLWCMHDHK